MTPASSKRRPRAAAHGGGDQPPPVPLHKRSSSHFHPAVRELGEEHLEAGRVQFEVDGDRARARIGGNGVPACAVGVDWSRVAEKRALHAFCNCRRFADGKPCEHVWATLLALDELGDNGQPPGRDRVSLRKDQAASWEDLGELAEPVPVPAVAVTPPAPPRRRTRRKTHQHGAISWRSQLDQLREGAQKLAAANVARPGAAGEPPFTHLLINAKASAGGGSVVLDLFVQRQGPGGRPGKLKRTSVEPAELAPALLPPDEPEGAIAIVSAFPGDTPAARRGGRRKKQPSNGIQQIALPRRITEPVLSHLARAGMLGWWDGRRLTSRRPLRWDSGAAWGLSMRLEPAGDDAMVLVGSLDRNGDSVPLDAPHLIVPTASDRRLLVLLDDAVTRLETDRDTDLDWINLLRDTGEILIPGHHIDEAMAELGAIHYLPPLEVPEDLQLERKAEPPRPRLMLSQDAEAVLPNAPLHAEMSFHYGDIEVSAADPRPTIVEWPGPKVTPRDMEAEHQALVRLLDAGVSPVPGGRGHELELKPQEVPAVAEPLLLEGWEVEVRGTSLRVPDPPSLRIESGIDWFELGGEVKFAGQELDLKEILAAVGKGETFIELADGSKGLLPSTWNKTYDSLAKLAQEEPGEEGLRFLPSQALLVDSLLVGMPPAAVDKAFAELRDKLKSFERIEPKKEPRGFHGELRGYQREGLGWLEFLREFGLGGVLADDMGLGKTVQVLALIKAHRTPKKTTGLPWLVVVPRSLLYNWIAEAKRFTPSVKVVEYGGPGREKLHKKLAKFDLVVTTYGTLRRDIGFLATIEFDTVILDEAQAIKNRESQSAKASRLLVARNRLALTGTPIENHLGELGSLFEFLNPGLLGRLPVLEVLSSGRNASSSELERVAVGVRPFILRRTKAQVLPDLPPKTEQVLHTTLNDEQRELYDQLRAGYQATLLERAESDGLAGSALQVLEALLRLRQVACHPGLIKEEWEQAGSSKLETLFELVSEVLDEGHKAIVFSQFTKLLGFVRRELDERGVEYAYLDGQTRKRAEAVERFQNDPECNLFLISLKAGGVGLNLTAAGYVFLLDPWWNPAVEAQAIDRAHRIGQTQPVFAYRLIAQDTVEEKILELQSSKRKVADAILGGEGGPISELTADDLKMLLS